MAPLNMVVQTDRAGLDLVSEIHDTPDRPWISIGSPVADFRKVAAAEAGIRLGINALPGHLQHSGADPANPEHMRRRFVATVRDQHAQPLAAEPDWEWLVGAYRPTRPMNHR